MQIIKLIMIASQNCINDFNHRFIVVHHFSAKLQKFGFFITPEYKGKGNL